MKRLILLGVLFASLIMQNAYADSTSVSCNSATAVSWTDGSYACGDDGNSASIQGTASSSDYLTLSLTDPSIASAQALDSIQVYPKGADANGSTLTIWLANFDDGGTSLSGTINMTWSGTEQYRSYGGHGDWNNSGTVTGQNLADGQYVIVMIPEDGYDYSTNNLTVNNLWVRYWWTSGVDTVLGAWVDSLYSDYSVSAGTNAPDTAKGGGSWKNTGNVLASDNAYTEFQGSATDTLAVKDLDYAISPNDRQVTHIKVSVECRAPHHGANKPLLDCYPASDIYTGGVWGLSYYSSALEMSGADSVLTFTDVWGMGYDDVGYLAYGQAQGSVNLNNFGVYLRCSDMGADTAFIDQVTVTVWYAGEADSVIFGAEMPSTAGYDSVIFCADTLNASYPDTDTYAWRFAVPYEADCTIAKVADLTVTETDSLKIATYIKDGAMYSDPKYASRDFYKNLNNPIWQIDSGKLYPDTGKVASAGWNTPMNVIGSENTRTYFAGTNGATYRLIACDFDCNLPTGARIVGVSAAIEGFGSTSSGGARAMAARLYNYTTALGTAKTFTLGYGGGTTDSTITLGSSSDLWGTGITLTVAIANSTNFSLCIYDNSSTAGQLNIDNVFINVYYESGVPIPKIKKQTLLRRIN